MLVQRGGSAFTTSCHPSPAAAAGCPRPAHVAPLRQRARFVVAHETVSGQDGRPLQGGPGPEGRRSPEKPKPSPGTNKAMDGSLGYFSGPLQMAQALEMWETEANTLRARALNAESEAAKLAKMAADLRDRAQKAEVEAMRSQIGSSKPRQKPPVPSVAGAEPDGYLLEAAVLGKLRDITHPAVSTSSQDLALKAELEKAKAALELERASRRAAEERASAAEVRALEAQGALSEAHSATSSLSAQYDELCRELEQYRATHSRNGNAAPSPKSARASALSSQDLDRQVEDLQVQLEDLDYRLNWALRDLRAHQLVLRAQGELNLHLSGLPSDMQQQVFDQVDNGAELLGDGGSATVHAVTLNGQELAVKVMPLYDINTARPYHFRDICTTFLRNRKSPFIELPLHTFLRLKDDEVEGTQYFLYTLWPRRHMDVDQLLCRRKLQPREIITIMLHTVLALQDLRTARMVHADVKPPNILVMLDDKGLVTTAHLTDFGSVQFVAPGADYAPAIWDGQLAWNWPPEQRERVYLDCCDVWGLALLYSCMKVANPTSPDLTDRLQDMSLPEPEFAALRDAQLLPDGTSDPQELRVMTALMRRCVVRDPRKRPGIAELAAVLQEVYNRTAPTTAGAPAAAPHMNGAMAVTTPAGNAASN